MLAKKTMCLSEDELSWSEGSSYGVKLDHPSIYDHGIAWTGCRESFFLTRSNNKRRHFFFACYNKAAADNTIRFIDAVENKLKLTPQNRCKIHRTNEPDILAIFFGPWWSKPLRQSLFTILIRAGQDYKRSFNKVLDDEEYLHYTKPAVKRFFAGFTEQGNVDLSHAKYGMGWLDIFEEMPQEEVAKALVNRRSNMKTITPRANRKLGRKPGAR